MITIEDYKEYCPVCQRSIYPDNFERVESGEDSCFLYIHDDVLHEANDCIAMANGIQ